MANETIKVFILINKEDRKFLEDFRLALVLSNQSENDFFIDAMANLIMQERHLQNSEDFDWITTHEVIERAREQLNSKIYSQILLSRRKKFWKEGVDYKLAVDTGNRNKYYYNWQTLKTKLINIGSQIEESSQITDSQIEEN